MLVRQYNFGQYARIVRSPACIPFWLGQIVSNRIFIMFVYGPNTSTGMVLCTPLMQSEVPEALRGGVCTFMDATWNLTRLISLGPGGIRVAALGIQMVY